MADARSARFPGLFELALAAYTKKIIDASDVIPCDEIKGFPVGIPSLRDQRAIVISTLHGTIKSSLDAGAAFPYVTAGKTEVCELCSSTISKFQTVEIVAEKISGVSTRAALKNPEGSIQWQCTKFGDLPANIVIGSFYNSSTVCSFCFQSSLNGCLALSTTKTVRDMSQNFGEEDADTNASDDEFEADDTNTDFYDDDWDIPVVPTQGMVTRQAAQIFKDAGLPKPKKLRGM